MQQTKSYRIIAVRVTDTALITFTTLSLAHATSRHVDKLVAGEHFNPQLQAAYHAKGKARVDQLATVNSLDDVEPTKADYAAKLAAEGYTVLLGTHATDQAAAPTVAVVATAQPIPAPMPLPPPPPLYTAPQPPKPKRKATAAQIVYLERLGVPRADAERLTDEQAATAIRFREDMATPAQRKYLTAIGYRSLPDDLDRSEALKLIDAYHLNPRAP